MLPSDNGAYDILVIDDDYAVREMLQEALEDAGYRVVSAENGEEALERLREHEQLPNVILLDLMMPVMTGWEFHQQQQRDERLAGIPVIVLSARPSLERDGFTMNVAGFIAKPLHLGNLFSYVDRYFA